MRVVTTPFMHLGHSGELIVEPASDKLFIANGRRPASGVGFAIAAMLAVAVPQATCPIAGVSLATAAVLAAACRGRPAGSPA